MEEAPRLTDAGARAERWRRFEDGLVDCIAKTKVLGRGQGRHPSLKIETPFGAMKLSSLEATCAEKR